MSPDIQASIKARLLNKVKETREEFELFLVRYACERFLFRLGASAMRDRCILKGAGLLTLWMNDPYRSTRDLDLLSIGSSDKASIINIMNVICSVPCLEDGLAFDLGSLLISPIREEDEYHGQRAVLNAYLGKAKIRVQIDFGFGDAVSPGPEDAEYPTIINGLPAPQLRIYPKVVTIAEKFEAMVKLGRTNSRMKDFHDIWALSSAYTHIKLKGFWNAYMRSSAFGTPPPMNFELIGERMRQFLGPIRDSILGDYPFEMFWPAFGPWK
jgi:hypothetical protein